MDKTYRTNDLPLAAYLVTTRSIPFLGCEEGQRGKVAFLFDDPQAMGERLAIEFTGGAECSASTYYNSVRYLRKVMDARLETNTEHDQYCNRRNRKYQ